MCSILKEGESKMYGVLMFTFPADSYFSLNLPKGAEILDVHAEDGEQQMFLIGDEDAHAPTEKRDFFLAGINRPISGRMDLNNLVRIGILHFKEGSKGYVFEIIRK